MQIVLLAEPIFKFNKIHTHTQNCSDTKKQVLKKIALHLWWEYG